MGAAEALVLRLGPEFTMFPFDLRRNWGGGVGWVPPPRDWQVDSGLWWFKGRVLQQCWTVKPKGQESRL